MLDLALRAIADPRRREILGLIQDRELSAGDIASRFNVTRPAISQHLRVLADAGLVNVRRQGTKRLYHVRPQGLAEVRSYLERFWDEGLQTLKREAESDERRARERRATGGRESGDRARDQNCRKP